MPYTYIPFLAPPSLSVTHTHTHTQCGPCRAFTPQLVKTYNKLKEEGKNFEILFLSSDRDEKSMMEYYETMPWLTLPYGDARKKRLSTKFDISGDGMNLSMCVL